MANIKAGTYRFNGVLSAPSVKNESLNENIEFTFYSSVMNAHCYGASLVRAYITADNPDGVGRDISGMIYTVVSADVDGNHVSVNRDYVAYVTNNTSQGYEEGWQIASYGESIQIVTIPYDQDVSDEFGTWFTANTKRLSTISYNGATIASLVGGQSATLKCKGMKMESDVVVDVAEVSAQLDTELAEQETLILELKESLEEFQSYGKNYIVFSNSDGLSLYSYGNKKRWNGEIEYSTDTINWSVWDGTTTLSAENGELYLRGTGNTYITGETPSGSTSGTGWILSGSNISCSGNIENLLDYATVANGDHPAMDDYCYLSMFYNCTSLVSAPELPATTLTYECYAAMFWGCTSLVSAPELPATTLAVACYRSMFRDCTSLVYAPKIHATTLADGCCSAMFAGCTSLVSAPELPATTLAESCYEFMFEDCTSLVYAPELPATTLAHRCYCAMFRRCTDLTTLPTLPATALTTVCYTSMFEGCTAIKLSESQTGDYKTAYRIPKSGTGNDSTASLKQMFDNTGGTFTGTPSINTVYYTSNVVVNSSDQKDLNKKRLQQNNLELAECLELATKLPSGSNEIFKPSHLTIHTNLMAYFKDKIEKPTFAQKLNFVDGRIFFDSYNSEQTIGCPVHSEYVDTDIGDGTMFEAVNISFRDVLGQRRNFWYVWEDDVPYAPAVISQLGVDGSVVTKEGWYELIVDGWVFHPVENASDIRNVSFGAVQPYGDYYYSLFDYKMSEDAENATPYLISTRIGEQNGIYLETKDKKCDTDIALLFSEKTFTVSQYRDLDVEHYYDAEFSTTEEFVDAVYVDIDYDGVEGLALQGDYYSFRPETGKTLECCFGIMREPGTSRKVFSGGGTSMGIKLYFVDGSGRFSSIHTNATILSMSEEEVIITGLRHNTYILVKAVGDDVGGDSGDDDTGGDTGGGDSGNTADYTVSVGDYFGIVYEGNSPAVECPSCLEYQDDGGELVFTGVSVGSGTIKLIRSSEVYAEYTVEVTA